MERPRNGCLEHKHHNTAEEGIRFRIVSANNSRLFARRRTTLRIQRLLGAAIEEQSFVAEGQSVSGNRWRRSAAITPTRNTDGRLNFLLFISSGYSSAWVGHKFHLFPGLAEGSCRVPAEEEPKSGRAGWVRVSGGREGSGFPNEIPAPVKQERPGLRPVAQPVIPAGNVNIYFQSAKE